MSQKPQYTRKHAYPTPPSLPHSHGRPHSHSHIHPHRHPGEDESNGVSRGGFVRMLLGGAGGVLLGKAARFLGLEHAMAADIKHIYLAPDDHTDYIWSAGETTYRNAFLEMLDWYLNQAEADINAGVEPEYHSRWNCDGHFWVWVYEKNKSAADFNRLIERIRDGHISVPLNALCICPGGAPLEAVLRGMYYPGQLERRYNLRFKLAYAMENQTLPYGLGAVWAGSGARYSWKGICWCATQVDDAWDREHEIYWYTGPDGSKILMKWNTMFLGNDRIGGYAEARAPGDMVEFVDGDPGFLARYTYKIIGLFGYGWDDIKTLLQRITFIDVARAKTINGIRHVYVSNEQDFFEAFETVYGTAEPPLPSLSCSFGNEWDLDCMIMAEVSARARRAVEKLRSAEAMATLVSLKFPAFLQGRQAARDLANMDLGLFWEHDFAGAPSPSLTTERIAWQKRITGEIESYVNSLYNDSKNSLGGLIIKSGTNARFFAFNPLSWARTDVADFPYPGSLPVHVVDLVTGLQVPSQIVSLSGVTHIRILAADIPAVGYKVFEIRAGAGQDFSAGAPSASGSQIENNSYRLVLANRGAVTSWWDKTRSLELVPGSAALNDLGAGTGTLTIENAGAVSVTLKAVVTGSTPLRHTTRVTLYRGIDRVEIRNTIDQNFNGVYSWKFNFNLANPNVWHEEIGAVIRARLTTDGGHYSPRNARYDWLSMNHFADMTGSGNVGVTLSNADCYFMQLGNSSVTTLDTTTARLSVLAGGDVNGYGIIHDQGGTDQNSFLQRFALQTHSAFNAVNAMRFSLEHQNPLVTGAVTGGSEYPETVYSFLTISNSNVLLWALKPAEDGLDEGIAARVWNLAGSSQGFSLAIQPELVAARHATHIETPTGTAPLSVGALSDTINSSQIKTYLLSITSTTVPLNPEICLPIVIKK